MCLFFPYMNPMVIFSASTYKYYKHTFALKFIVQLIAQNQNFQPTIPEADMYYRKLI